MADTPDHQVNPDAGLQPTDQPPVAPGENSGARNQVRYQLGDAVDAHVVQVRDRVLDRRAHARVSSLAGADDLEQEARFLARLDHAGSPGVLDFVRGDAGAMLVTRRIEGITLAEAVRQARDGVLAPELASISAVIQTVSKACDAISAAHAQGVVHHAIAPDRILLGGHGQVVVVGWAEAIAAKRSPATMRYISSPAPSERLALDGMHQDIRSLGACLLEALIWRAPQPAGGDAIGHLQPCERQRLPAGLESVVRLALASDPGTGYRSVAHLVQDLTRCADGLMPVAHVPGPGARFAEWLHRRRRPLFIAVAAGAILAVAGGLLWGRQLHDLAAWRVVASEDFSDPGWSKRWVEPPSPHGMFALRDGRLVSTADRDAFLILRQRLSTPVAIEYTGEMLAGSQPCDLSVQWSEGSGVAEDPGRFDKDCRSYMIQAGAFGNSFCAIYQNPGRRLMAHANRQLEPGRRYRFRVELDGARIVLSIDGVKTVEAEDDFPTRSGFIALYGFYPGKAFDDVRVLQRSPSTPPTAFEAGDAAFLERRYEPAARLYARIAEAATDGAELQQALYRKGLAEWNLGQDARAAASWDRVSDPALAGRIACVRLESLFKTGQMTPHSSWLEERYREQPAQRESLRQDWRRIVQQQLDAPQRNPVAIDYLLGVRDRLFPEDGSCSYVAATTLLALGRFEDVLARFPEQRHPCARAMLALGRSQDLIDAPWVGNDERIHALGMRGEFARVLDSPGLMPLWRVRTLIRLERYEEALQVEDSAYPVLLHLGRGAELLETPGTPGWVVNEALISLGRLREASGDGLPQAPGSGSSTTAMLMLGQIELAERLGRHPLPAIRFMVAAEQGDDIAYADLHDRIALPTDLGATASWFAPVAMRPFVDALHGDRQALERQLRPLLPLLEGVYSRTGWHVARALLGDAPVDSVSQMPCRYDAPAWRLVTAGMRAELLGQPAEAQRAYAAFTSMPMHKRLLAQHQPDVDVEWFVAWRLRALGGKP